jgi:hypothetical protein
MIHSIQVNVFGQRGLARMQKENPELHTIQVIKIRTHTLTEKTAFAKASRPQLGCYLTCRLGVFQLPFLPVF